MRYTPAPVPAGIPKSARAWLADELRKVASAVIEADAVNLAEQAIEPVKLADGIVAYANGVDWDPGLGEGVYARINATWESLGYGNLNSAADETILGDWIFSGSVDFDNTVDFTGATVVGLSSDDLSDVASIAMLDEDETVTGEWTHEQIINVTGIAAGSFIAGAGVKLGSSAPGVIYDEEDQTGGDERLWTWGVGTRNFRLQTYKDDESVGATPISVVRKNNSVDIEDIVFTADDLALKAEVRVGVDGGSKKLRLEHDDTDAYINVFESAGDLYLNNGATSKYGPAALGILDPKSIADDATQTWTLHRTIGIMIMTNNFGISTSAIIAYSGTSMSVIWKGTNVSVGTSGSNPDVDTDVNIWISPSGTLNIKNRMGSTRTFDIYTFVG